MSGAGAASIDGVVGGLDAARVPVTDRGFLYGDAVFEALRTYGGEPDALDQHLSRLARSCAILGIGLPVTLAQLADEVRMTIAAVSASERYVRIMITRGDLPEALPPGGAGRARRVIIVRPLGAPSSLLYERGIKLRSTVAPTSALYGGAKPAAYLSNMLAIAAAQRDGADDALLLGAHGELLEGATSSLFLVRGTELLTPPLSLGILPGITRDRVWEAAQQQGLRVRERLLTIHDAYRAEELFLTSSVRQVVGVVELDGLTLGAGLPGPITRKVAAAYRAQLAT